LCCSNEGIWEQRVSYRKRRLGLDRRIPLKKSLRMAVISVEINVGKICPIRFPIASWQGVLLHDYTNQVNSIECICTYSIVGLIFAVVNVFIGLLRVFGSPILADFKKDFMG